MSVIARNLGGQCREKLPSVIRLRIPIRWATWEKNYLRYHFVVESFLVHAKYLDIPLL